MTTPDDSSSPKPSAASDGGDRRRTVRMAALGLAGLAVVGAGGFAAFQLGERGDPMSAAEGAEGTRTFEGAPLEMPTSLVPAEALEVQGTVARFDTSWSAAVRFSVSGDHEELARAADPGMLADGFTMRQRAYDEDTMQVIYDGEDGATLTVTYMRSDTDGEPVTVAAVLVGP